MSATGSKDIRQMVRALRKQRWTVVPTNGGHQRATSPDGEIVHMPSTTSSWSTIANVRSQLRKAGAQL